MRKSRSPLRILWPLFLVLLIAAGWSVYWYIAAEKAKQSFAKYLDRNRAAGIDIACDDAAWSGYPFRFELNCSALRSTGERGGVSIDFSGGAVHAVALAYNPLHLIVEMAGPFGLTMAGPSGEETVISSKGKLIRASIRVGLNPNRPDQISILAENHTGTIATPKADADGRTPVPYTFKQLNLHSRFVKPPANQIAPFDFAVQMSDLAYGPDHSVLFGTEALQVETATLNANITQVPIARNMPFKDRARKWQQADGLLSVRDLEVKSNFLTGSSQGALSLDAEGRLNGKLEWIVTGFDDLMARLRNAELIETQEAAIADTLMTVLGKPDGNKPGLKLRTTLKNGKLYFGPFRAAKIPPLF